VNNNVVIIVHLQVMSNLGATDVDSRLEEQLIDGILYAFQEQTNEVCMFVCTYTVYIVCALCTHVFVA